MNAPEELPQSQRDGQRRVDWMVKALDEGIGDELTRLKSFVVYGHIGMGTDEYEDWLETFGAAGLEWPEPWDDDALVDYQSSDVVAEIDFHFWHHCAGDGHGPRYADGHRMGEDIAVLRDGIDSLSESYPDLGWAMGGAAFLAEMPEGLEKVYYKGATPAYQAGMLVRRMLYAKAKGASRVLWHTFMARIVDMGANFGRQYDANGLRNDLYLQGSDYYPDSYKKLLFTNYAWRRPSWFSLRRLAWLLSRTRKLDFYYDSTNIVVILCEAKSNSGYRNPRALAGEKTTTYSRAWVAWMDQTASVDSVRLTFRGTSSDFTVLPLVPLVTLPSDDTSYDDDDYKASDANYPDFEEIEWTNKDHCSAAVSARTDSASLHYRYIDIDLEKASQGNPAPICVLTDADVELVDMERDPDTAPYEEGLAIRMYGPNLAAVGDVRDPLEVAPSQLATSTKAWWIP